MDARTYNMLKAMLSTLHSDERAPYDRAPKRRNNIASLCATGNNERFLINDQGTRRMLVFRVEVVKPPIDYPFNYEGIYAQAYYLMQSGFQYYFSKEEQAELERHNKQFELESLLENAVESVFRKPTGDEVGEWFRPGQIAILLQQRYHIRFDENKIGMVMTTLGFQATYHRGKKGYRVMVMDYDEERRIRKEKAVQSVSLEPEETQTMDISQAPPSIQEGYSRLLGEKDEEEEEDE
jgi:predicted P-loop ATPase